MKNFIKSFRITIAFCIFFSVFYILVLWIFAQFAGRGRYPAQYNQKVPQWIPEEYCHSPPHDAADRGRA